MKELLTSTPAVRLKDYFLSSVPHLTPKKILNIFKAEMEFSLRRGHCSSYPYLAQVDLTNICHLKCPLCATGQGLHQRPAGIMPFATFKKLIDEIGNYLLFIHFVTWGEPFLNPEATKFFRYAHQKNIGSQTSTSFSFPMSPKKMEDLVKSGLEILSVSLDGITPKVYNRYRVGGDFYQVIKNVKLLAQTKKKLKSKIPKIQWQFLVNRFNEHQIPKLPALARKLGFDSLVVSNSLVVNFGQSKNDHIKITDWIAKNKKYQPQKHSLISNKTNNIPIGGCWWLWRDFTLSHDGGISPCCYNTVKDQDFGNILESNFRQIWNNQKYFSARRLFRYQKTAVKTICNHCEIVPKKPK